MRTIIFKGKHIEVPGIPEELTPGQYREYVRLAMLLTGGHIDLRKWRTAWYSILAGLEHYSYEVPHDRYRREAESQLAEVTDPYLVDHGGGPVPRFDSCRNLLPEYGGYKGPADWLNDVRFDRFVECATIIEAHHEDDGDYAEVARVLYSIPPEDDVPMILAWHAPMLFLAVWKAIQSGPIEINGRDVDFSIIFRSSGPRRPDDKTGWAGITFEIATSGVFGNVAEVEASPFWSVLMYLYKCKFEYIHDKSKK